MLIHNIHIANEERERERDSQKRFAKILKQQRERDLKKEGATETAPALEVKRQKSSDGDSERSNREDPLRSVCDSEKAHFFH